MNNTRRNFLLQASSALALGGLSLDLLAPNEARGEISSPALPGLALRTPILVVVELAGGNDVLNTHVPIAVPGVTAAYRAARPNLAMKTASSSPPYSAPSPSAGYLPPALDLDGAWGLHGCLVGLANRWHSHGDVAIVQGIGETVVKERSHDAAKGYRASGAFSGPRSYTGWLGRYNDLRWAGAPLAPSVLSAMGGERALTGHTTAAVKIGNPQSFCWKAAASLDDVAGYLGALNAGWDVSAIPAGPLAASASALNAATAASAALKAASIQAPSSFPQGSIGWQLAEAAMMIKAGIVSQTYYTVMNGFDTHAGQAYMQYALFLELDAALTSFFSILGAGPRAADVVVLITSEFGRQVTENAAGGTDHGMASSAILIGGGVRGGLYGASPNMAAREHDALVATTDFRSLYATLITHLSGDAAVAAAVLGRDEGDHDFPLIDLFS